MIRLGLQAFVTTFVSSSTRHRAPALTQLPVHNFNSWLNMGKSAKKFYAVHRGKNGFQGVLNDWPTCQRQVNGVTGAVFKSFQTRAEAVAFAENGWSSLRESRKRDASSSRGESSEKVERPTAAGTPLGGKEGSDDTDPMTLVVYTDGACTGNGKAIAKAGVGVYFGDGDELNYSAKLDGELQTNQRAEMVAVLKAMTLSLEHGRVKAGFTLRIWTDSVVRFVGSGSLEVALCLMPCCC